MTKTWRDIVRERIIAGDKSDEYFCQSAEEFADLYIDASDRGLLVCCKEQDENGNAVETRGSLGPFGVIKLRMPKSAASSSST